MLGVIYPLRSVS